MNTAHVATRCKAATAPERLLALVIHWSRRSNPVRYVPAALLNEAAVSSFSLGHAFNHASALRNITALLANASNSAGTTIDTAIVLLTTMKASDAPNPANRHA